MANLPELDANYWQGRWQRDETGWDVGYATPPIAHFLDRLPNRQLRVLIPGAGNAWEAELAWRLGFENVWVVDLAQDAIQRFLARVPNFPPRQAVVGDFFALEGPFDVVVEQTFFCALNPARRQAYADHMARLLPEGGVLAGLLFNDALNTDRPPFGGNPTEYAAYFQPYFSFRRWEAAADSIAPRAGREWWMELVRNATPAPPTP